MLPFLAEPKIFAQPVWLSREEKENPMGVFENVFEDYKLNELHGYLWQMVQVCLTSENYMFSDALQRSDLLMHYETFERMFEAAFSMVSRKVRQTAH